MPDLMWFEWERPNSGYRLERLDLDWIIRGHEFTKGQWLIEDVADDAPSWVNDMVLACDGYSEEISQLFESGFLTGAENFCLVPNDGFEADTYEPFKKYPTLFMELAELEPTPDSVLKFANKYGALNKHKIHAKDKIGLYRVAHLPTKVFRSMYAIRGMKRAVNAWFDYKETGIPDSLIALLPDDYHDPRKLLDVKPEWPAFGLKTASLDYRMRRLPGTGKLSMYLTPEDLLSCIWVQFLQAVTNDAQLKQCAECPTWFSFGKGTGRRRSAHYCSDRCRKAAHERRKRE